jgi:hypothetical protein
LIKYAHGSLVPGGVLVFLFCLIASAWAGDYTFPSSAAVTTGRSCQPDTADPADTLVVTVTVDNTEPDSLRGLYFSDHLPVQFFGLDTRQVRVNGILLADTAYVYETGPDDDVFPGTRPHRWIIEAPADSTGSRSCSHTLDPGTGSLEIVYAVRCTTLGRHDLPSYTWAAQLTGGDYQEVFGYCDSVFILVSGPPDAVDDLLARKAGTRVHLCWSEPHADMGIAAYVIYRDSTADFTSWDGDSIAATADTFFIDADGGIGDPALNRYYLIRAVDGAGKRSDDSNCAGEFDRELSSTK